MKELKCPRCGSPVRTGETECEYCGVRFRFVGSRSAASGFSNPMRPGTMRFAAHADVINRIAEDVARSCANSYAVTKTKNVPMKSCFNLTFGPREIFFNSYSRFLYRNYGMADMNIKDVADFRAYFRNVFTQKFRAELDKESGGRYEFTIEDEFHDNMFDSKWWLKITVWYTVSGLKSW